MLPALEQVRYTGYFISESEKERLSLMYPPKHEVVFLHHSTNVFKPTHLNDLEVGKKIQLEIIGRVFDDKGDCLLVKNNKSHAKHPHITVSCAVGIKSMYSNELCERGYQENFVEMFDVPTYVEVTEGWAGYDGVVHLG